LKKRGGRVADEPESRVATFEVASSKLREGLKNCRAMVATYRAMIVGRQRRADVPIEDAGCNDAGGPIDPAAEPEHSLEDW
jgi:hypothetical protein